jgi:hypothetical protein
VSTTSKVNTERSATTKWIAITDLQICPAAQRDYSSEWATKIASKFSLESMGYPVVNHRGGVYYIIDGQHRVAAMKMLGFLDSKVECECYESLSETEEAELFLTRNYRRGVRAYDRFRISLTADRDIQTNIAKIVNSAGLHVGTGTTEGSIRATATLEVVYNTYGGAVLRRTLLLIRDSFGSPGFDANVIKGIALVCQRYGDEFSDGDAITRLSSIHGGVSGLLGKATVLRKQTSAQKGHCVAAAVVDILNSGRGGHKLTPWWAGRSRGTR